jgi:hypothetical protein
MKKHLALTAILGSLIIFAPAMAEAKTADSVSGTVAFANNVDQRWEQRRRNNRWDNRRVRVVNRTRIVRRGFRTYREIWQYRYLPNGRVQTRLISRTLIR